MFVEQIEQSRYKFLSMFFSMYSFSLRRPLNLYAQYYNSERICFLKKQTETKIRRKKGQIALQQQAVQLRDGSNPENLLGWES